MPRHPNAVAFHYIANSMRRALTPRRGYPQASLACPDCNIVCPPSCPTCRRCMECLESWCETCDHCGECCAYHNEE